MRSKEEAINLIKNEIKEHQSIGLSLGEIGSAGWKKSDMDFDDSKAVGYISALSWAYGITPEELVEEKNKECKVIFGIDIKTDTTIPKGTVAIGFHKGDVITITKLKKFPEEKKTLSDKSFEMDRIINKFPQLDVSTEEGEIKQYAQEKVISCFLNDKVYLEKDVKEAIKDIKEDFKKYRDSQTTEEGHCCCAYMYNEMIEIINKRIGERLI